MTLSASANTMSRSSLPCIFIIVPEPVSGLRVVSVGVTQATLSWNNHNATASYRVFLQSYGMHGNSTPDPVVNISDLKSGFEPRVAWHVPEPNETQNDPVLSEGGPGESQNCASHTFSDLGVEKNHWVIVLQDFSIYRRLFLHALVSCHTCLRSREMFRF